MEKRSAMASKSERGQSLVELAISLVLLLLLLSGIIDLGRALFTYISMRDAAQEGVVYASVYPKPCDRIQQRALQALDNPAGMSVDVTLNHMACASAGPADSCAGNPISVTVRNPNFEITMPFLGGVLGKQTLSLNATITGTVLQPRCIP